MILTMKTGRTIIVSLLLTVLTVLPASSQGYALRRQATLVCRTDTTCPPEGFTLRVTPDSIIVGSSDADGRYYALVTLQQMGDTLPCGTLAQQPRTHWRGLMLDSGRQYQQVSTIKTLLDLMASLKMNIFHWHLTEGLGWRIDIERYPRLATVGSRVAHGKEQQGCYSHADIREVVAYAAARHITVVPEIDLPGHAEAALNAYPSLTCSGQAPRVPETGFTDALFCAGRDSVLLFLYDVLDEVCDLFPSPYIHLGGDEAPKGQWNRCPACQQRIADEGLRDSHDLQRWLSAQMARHLEQRGRHAIFWEDILYSDGTPLPDGTAVQWWNYRGHRDRGLREAIRQGLPVVASPNYYCYLNFPETPWRGYGPDRTFTYADAAQRNPADAALTDHPDALLGMEAALWTDYNLTEDLLLPRLLPRLYPLAHQMWGH